ncbi:hypothetical protein OZZ15_00465 [[Ruminococcus] gnavus]|uniref:hypothetical protein n=1 Tax=Mediterraneibacter gnavus TaxID=33038 RepID=UPI002286B213|nr:hypothetical protein [Mediterraneibacter gnavus]MCZ0628950.1 hypothetical protein [Mediterraneibacter gnavus]
MRTFTNKKAVPVKQTAKQKLQYVRKNWQLYLFFLMPALLLTIIFKYIPMSGVLIAFEDYNVIDGVFGSEWVGLEYFQRFLSSPDFMNYLMNTLKLSAYGLLWGFPVPIILALLLNRIRKAGIRKKIQLLIYAPNFISVIVLCGMIRMFLSPVGPINQVLGIDTNWMTMPESFRTIYIASGIWQTDMNLPASEILSTYVYRIGLLNGDYGYSTAVGLFNSIINVILLIAVNWIVKKLNDGEGL